MNRLDEIKNRFEHGKTTKEDIEYLFDLIEEIKSNALRESLKYLKLKNAVNESEMKK